MRNNKSLFANIDWPLVCIYLLMLFFGWLNIYAANYGEGIHDLMTMSSEPGKQLFWIGTSFIFGSSSLSFSTVNFILLSLTQYTSDDLPFDRCSFSW